MEREQGHNGVSWGAGGHGSGHKILRGFNQVPPGRSWLPQDPHSALVKVAEQFRCTVSGQGGKETRGDPSVGAAANHLLRTASASQAPPYPGRQHSTAWPCLTQGCVALVALAAGLFWAPATNATLLQEL